MSKRVLVTGGAGFLGSHLVERLLTQGNTVVCVDNFFTGREANLVAVREHPLLTVLEHDITEPLDDVLAANPGSDVAFDEIYNLACPASPVHYQHDPVKTITTNVLGSINVLNLSRRFNAKILQASTSEVYGDPLVHPQPETYWGHVNPTGVRSCYDEGKRAAETLFFDYHREYGTRIKVARIFNTYGPRMDPSDGRVVSNFIMQALRGDDITVYGDGKQTRSFCYVDDLIDAFLRLMATSDDVTGPVNLGNPAEFTMLELANEVIRATQSTSHLTHLPLPGDDPHQRQPDITLARDQLGWAPTTPLVDGLTPTIDYFTTFIDSDAVTPRQPSR